jgi:Rod binding domain-containing protein
MSPIPTDIFSATSPQSPNNLLYSNPSPKGKLNPNTTAANSPAERKLHKAAAEFESLLFSNLWKSMKSSLAASDDDSSDPAHQSLEELGMEAISSAIGQAGGLGIGQLILRHLEPKLTQSQSATYQPSKNGTGKVGASTADRV